jgi:hypothetical protein
MTKPGDTITMRILNAYASGAPLTYRQVQEISGERMTLVMNVARRLVLRGYLDRIAPEPGAPMHARITALGRRSLDKDRLPAIAHDPSVPIVQAAIASRPALAVVWMSQAHVDAMDEMMQEAA